MSTVRPDVRAFFEHYERAGQDPDDGALARCFCDVFISLDPSSATAVSPQALLASLPRRKALFEAIGSDGLELADITEMPLDDAHTLVRSSWRLRVGDESTRDRLTLLSTFVLRKESGAWRIALYLNHQNMYQLFGDLAQQA
jgi:hypothetical protein